MFFLERYQTIGGYVIFAGLEQIIEYIQNLKFDDTDIDFLKRKKIFSNEFLEYLKGFKFTGDIWAVPEGTVVFPNEPLITVKAPIIQAQLLETMLLLLINHQSLIATKSSRIVNAAKRTPSNGIWSKKSTSHRCSSLWGKSCNYRRMRTEPLVV